jgi:DNA-binding GntR family transcriptional regulator
MFLQQRREISLMQHASIIEALKMRDGMVAKQRLESHLRAGGDDLVRYLYNNKPG